MIALFCRPARTGLGAAGPAVAYHEDSPAGQGAVIVHAAVPVTAGADRAALRGERPMRAGLIERLLLEED